MKATRFSAAVLAGGRSTRMGVDKAFLPLGREVLLERQLRILREAGAAEVLISGRIGVDYSGLDARVVYDREPDRGPLGGVAAILRAASFSPVIILAVDMPSVSANLLRQLVSGSSEVLGCVPVTGEGHEPLAAAYPASVLAVAERHLAEGNYAMKEFVGAAIALQLVRPLITDPLEENLFVNWNRPLDRHPHGG